MALLINGLPTDVKIDCGPHTAFMSLSFRPTGIASLNQSPLIVLKEKDQDFTLGKTIYSTVSAKARAINSIACLLYSPLEKKGLISITPTVPSFNVPVSKT